MEVVSRDSRGKGGSEQASERARGDGADRYRLLGGRAESGERGMGGGRRGLAFCLASSPTQTQLMPASCAGGTIAGQFCLDYPNTSPCFLLLPL